MINEYFLAKTIGNDWLALHFRSVAFIIFGLEISNQMFPGFLHRRSSLTSKVQGFFKQTIFLKFMVTKHGVFLSCTPRTSYKNSKKHFSTFTQRN
jgi:hypothetical protein